jgi:thiamine biosynthesis protein ThiS
MPITIHLNGEAMALEAPQTVEALIARLGLDASRVAIERNLAIVPRSLYNSVSLQEGDRLELVHFIGGG